ncbi:MAG: hypothetical protein ABIH83_04390 [Candidatus Micrarchaeota archaeon]
MMQKPGYVPSYLQTNILGKMYIAEKVNGKAKRIIGKNLEKAVFEYNCKPFYCEKNKFWKFELVHGKEGKSLMKEYNIGRDKARLQENIGKLLSNPKHCERLCETIAILGKEEELEKLHRVLQEKGRIRSNFGLEMRGIKPRGGKEGTIVFSLAKDGKVLKEVQISRIFEAATLTPEDFEFKLPISGTIIKFNEIDMKDLWPKSFQ